MRKTKRDSTKLRSLQKKSKHGSPEFFYPIQPQDVPLPDSDDDDEYKIENFTHQFKHTFNEFIKNPSEKLTTIASKIEELKREQIQAHATNNGFLFLKIASLYYKKYLIDKNRSDFNKIHHYISIASDCDESFSFFSIHLNQFLQKQGQDTIEENSKDEEESDKNTMGIEAISAFAAISF